MSRDLSLCWLDVSTQTNTFSISFVLYSNPFSLLWNDVYMRLVLFVLLNISRVYTLKENTLSWSYNVHSFCLAFGALIIYGLFMKTLAEWTLLHLDIVTWLLDSTVEYSSKLCVNVVCILLILAPASIWAEGQDRTKPKLDCNLLAYMTDFILTTTGMDAASHVFEQKFSLWISSVEYSSPMRRLYVFISCEWISF